MELLLPWGNGSVFELGLVRCLYLSYSIQSAVTVPGRVAQWWFMSYSSRDWESNVKVDLMSEKSQQQDPPRCHHWGRKGYVSGASKGIYHTQKTPRFNTDHLKTVENQFRLR